MVVILVIKRPLSRPQGYQVFHNLQLALGTCFVDIAVALGEEGGGKNGKNYETKKPKSTLLADNARGLIITKQTKLRTVASATPHPIIKLSFCMLHAHIKFHRVTRTFHAHRRILLRTRHMPNKEIMLHPCQNDDVELASVLLPFSDPNVWHMTCS